MSQSPTPPGNAMMRWLPLLIVALLGLLLLAGVMLSRNPDRESLPSPLIGKPAPAFSLPALTDPSRTIGTEDLKGQVSLLNVWGTWCVECRYEHGFLVELSRTAGIPIYGLNVKDDRDSALGWLASLGNPYVESGFDADGGVAVDWGVYGAPETFLIGRDGTVLHKHISVLTPEIWRRDFVPLIVEKCGGLPCPLGGKGGE